MKLLFFDTETTGIRPGSICQLSYITVDSSVKPQKTVGKNYFFTVEHMDAEAEAVHGFSLEKLYELSNGEYFEDRFNDFIKDFYQADVVIGHNVSFDIKFLKHELEGIGELFEPKRLFCTMAYYKNVCRIPNLKGDYKNPKLEEVIKYLNIDKASIEATASKLFEANGNYHDARFDTAATYLVVTEGIKKGFIPHGYFSKLCGKI
ncbi:3'-5' exonuclease [Clostridium polynesiense]|uniref:3'-5' exonuclease n=1 Tax=Clostridium polynesiense TaxID=1325933 RepID=UPI00058CC670|nr:3'-5' exonuclease [Clostridium polynesiense]